MLAVAVRDGNDPLFGVNKLMELLENLIVILKQFANSFIVFIVGKNVLFAFKLLRFNIKKRF